MDEDHLQTSLCGSFRAYDAWYLATCPFPVYFFGSVWKQVIHMTGAFGLRCADYPPHRSFQILSTLNHQSNEVWGETNLTENRTGQSLARLCVSGWSSPSPESPGSHAQVARVQPCNDRCPSHHMYTWKRCQARQLCRLLQGDILLTFHSDDICVSAHVSKPTDFGRIIVIFPFITVLGGIVQSSRLSQRALFGEGPGQSALPQRRQTVNEVHRWQIAFLEPLNLVFLVLPEGSSGLAQLDWFNRSAKVQKPSNFPRFQNAFLFPSWLGQGSFTGVQSSNTDMVQKRKEWQ